MVGFSIRKWLAALLIQGVFCIAGFSQTVSPGAPDFLWARQVGQGGQDLGWSIAVDSEGNAYVGAMFSSSSIDLGGTILTNRGGFDGILAKYDRNGNLVWAKQAGGSQNEEIKSVAIDGNGNVYAAGSSRSTEGTFAGATIGNDGGQDFFVAKL